MYLPYLILLIVAQGAAQLMKTRDFNFRVDAGGRTCFFETGKAGQLLEVYYQVLDGQHGELDISLDLIDPLGQILATDYKRPQNSIIRDLEVDGDYAICLDNTFSVMNSKLVFLYVMTEDVIDQETVVSDIDDEGKEKKEVLHWAGIDLHGEKYYIDIAIIADSLSRTLKYIVKARHMLDLYVANKSRDVNVASEESFIVDVWSGFQIAFMCVVGLLQVFMIKKLFSTKVFSPSYL